MRPKKNLLIIATTIAVIGSPAWAGTNIDNNLTDNVKKAGDQYEQTMQGIIQEANNSTGGTKTNGTGELGTMLSLSFQQAAAEIKKDAQVGANQALSSSRKTAAKQIGK